MLVLDRDHLAWFGQLTFKDLCACVCGLSVIHCCRGIF